MSEERKRRPTGEFRELVLTSLGAIAERLRIIEANGSILQAATRELGQQVALIHQRCAARCEE